MSPGKTYTLEQLRAALPTMGETVEQMSIRRRPNPQLFLYPLTSMTGPWLPEKMADMLGLDQQIQTELSFLLEEGSPTEPGKRKWAWDQHNGLMIRTYNSRGSTGFGFSVLEDFRPYSRDVEVPKGQLRGSFNIRSRNSRWENGKRLFMMDSRIAVFLHLLQVAIPETEAYWLAKFVDLEAGPKTPEENVKQNMVPVETMAEVGGEPESPFDE